MRDLKRTEATKKVRGNRRKKQKKPINLRLLLHRSLRIGISLFSVVLVAVGGFFLVQLVLASDQFRIDRIKVHGNQRLCEQTLVALSDVQLGMSTFSLDLELIGRKIAENPWVREARIQRIFPRQISITVVERNPVAIVNLGYLYYLDADGVVFKVLEATDALDFPVVTGFDATRLQRAEQKDRDQLVAIVALLDDLSHREQFSLDKVSEIHRDAGGGLTLYTLNDGVRIRMGYDNYSEKLDRFERIYSLLKPKMNMFDYIDLNVDEKVIVRIERPDRAAKS